MNACKKDVAGRRRKKEERARAAEHTARGMGARKHKFDKETGEKLTRLHIRDKDGPARWAAWRGMGRAARGEIKKPGHSDAAEAARAIIHTLTLECAHCGALVDWRAAKTAMSKARGHKRTRGCGCAGKQCAKKCKPNEFRRKQHEMAAKMRAGKRVLVAWPRSVKDVDTWARPKAAALRAAQFAEENA